MGHPEIAAAAETQVSEARPFDRLRAGFGAPEVAEMRAVRTSALTGAGIE
jgi:hypothetical protein